MALGGRMILKYGGRPGIRPPTTDTRLRAFVGFVFGAAILGGLMAWADESRAGVTAVRIYALVIAGPFALSRVVLGWREEGLCGVWCRLGKPL